MHCHTDHAPGLLTSVALCVVLVYSRTTSGVPTSPTPVTAWAVYFSPRGGCTQAIVDAIGDPITATAVLDRLLHQAVVMNIRGESYRLKDRWKAGVTPMPLLGATPTGGWRLRGLCHTPRER
jgi:hypothetical protein